MKNKILLITFFFIAYTNINAQWAIQSSVATDTISNVFCTDVNNCYACGATQTFTVALHTINGGLNWNPFTAVPVCFSFYFTDANTGYIGGFDTIYKTTNGGANWSKYAIATGQWVGFSIYFYNSNVGYAAGVNYISNTPGVYHTSDAGVTWTAATSGGTCASDGSRCISCTSANTCYDVGWNGGNAGVNKTTDGGATWTNIFTAAEDISSVYFTSATTGVITGGGTSMPMKIYRTTDGGTNWTPVYAGADGEITSVYFTDANTGYATGWGGIILKTTDGGSSWNPMTSPTTNDLRGLYFPSSTIGYAVGSGVILKYNGATGVWELYADAKATCVYPNPSSGHFTLQINSEFNLQNSKLEIFNALDEKIYETNIFQPSTDIQLKVPAGIYFVTVTNEEKMITQKLVIR